MIGYRFFTTLHNMSSSYINSIFLQKYWLGNYFREQFISMSQIKNSPMVCNLNYINYNESQTYIHTYFSNIYLIRFSRNSFYSVCAINIRYKNL